MLLLAFASDNDKNKFEYIYEKYKRLLWHKAYEILRDQALAEDAASEAFLRIYRNLHKIDEPDSGRTAAFLVTIVKNVAITIYNREKKAQAGNIDEFDGADDFDLEEFVASGDAARRALELLENLGEDLKAVFLLKYARDLSHKEIGKILGITENNVTVRLHRAKKKLSRLVKEA